MHELGFSGAVLSEWRKLITEQLDIETDIVMGGGGISDLSHYKERVGRIYAYRQTLALAEEAASNIEKRG